MTRKSIELKISILYIEKELCKTYQWKPQKSKVGYREDTSGVEEILNP